MGDFIKEDAKKLKDMSILGRLLSEISWEGKKVTRYRDGGHGLENVLTTEVLQTLYFLPRTHFLGEIIRHLHMTNSQIKEIIYSEIEESDFDLFPGNHYLIKAPVSHQKGMSVQPDAWLETQSTLSLIELKRIRHSSFQKEQLAREFYLCTRDAKDKVPLLILIVSKEPPLSVKGEGRVDPADYIKKTLPKVYDEADSHPMDLKSIQDLVDDHIAWITWDEIYGIVNIQLQNYNNANKAERKSVERLTQALMHSIERHR